MTTCLIEGGCPCDSTTCKRKGKCAECIKFHYEEKQNLCWCMRIVTGQYDGGPRPADR